MNPAENLQSESAEQRYQVIPGSQLGQVLRGLDPGFALDTLSDWHRQVVELRNGVFTGEQLTYQATADRLGRDRSRIQDINNFSLIKLGRLRDYYSPERVFQQPPRFGASTWEDTQIPNDGIQDSSTPQ